MSTCTYQRNYIDFKTKKGELFQCQESLWKYGRCKFHSKKYLKDKTRKDLQKEQQVYNLQKVRTWSGPHHGNQ
ncbi:MAG: hypothetical protein OEL81_00405 [Nitrosopumilus sp.]|nr:hypothetical protein [Nitrosopumilus sp.]